MQVLEGESRRGRRGIEKAPRLSGTGAFTRKGKGKGMPLSLSSVSENRPNVKRGHSSSAALDERIKRIEYDPVAGGTISLVCPDCGDLTTVAVYRGRFRETYNYIGQPDWHCVRCQRLAYQVTTALWEPAVAFEEPLTREERFHDDDLRRHLGG